MMIVGCCLPKPGLLIYTPRMLVRFLHTCVAFTSYLIDYKYLWFIVGAIGLIPIYLVAPMVFHYTEGITVAAKIDMKQITNDYKP